MKEWLFLIGAIVLETFATTMLKYSEQFTKLLPTIGMLAGYLLSFYCLSHALRTLPIGIANSFTDNLIAEQRYRMILDGLQQ